MRLVWLLLLLGCTRDADSAPAVDDPCDSDAMDDDCDSVDDDCDGEVDEDALRVDGYADLDGDGYGDPNAATTSCGDGAVARNSRDCNDTNPDVHPGAEETCDGTDQDCDGAVDENAVDGLLGYADADADGWGDPTSPLVRCGSLPSGWLTDSGDCDDTHAAANPDGTEVCGNGLDDDCDGVSESCEAAAADADAIWEGEASYDRAGFALAPLGDANGDGYDDYAIAAPHEYASSGFAGSVYFVDGTARGTASLSTAAGVLTGAADDVAGRSLSYAGDVDGDGVGELWVGAYGNDDAGTDAGCVHLVSADWTGASTLAAEHEAVLVGEDNGAGAGFAVAAAGDVNGDGIHDVVVGSNLPSSGTFVVYGPFSGSRDLASADVKLTDFWAGQSVAGGHDTDGDGLDDLVVGAPYEGGGTDSEGAAYVVSAPSTGSSVLETYPKIYGEVHLGYLGKAVTSPGDLDEDGYADVMVAGNGGVGPGASVFFGPVTSSRSIRTADVTMAVASVVGTGLAGPGDYDGDGHPDVIVESNRHFPTGAAWVLYGPMAGGTIDLEAGADVTFIGEAFGDEFGYRVAFAGDVDGDGADDVLVGAPDRAGSYGAAYLFVGM